MNWKKHLKVVVILFITWTIIIFSMCMVFEYKHYEKQKVENVQLTGYLLSGIRDWKGNSIERIPDSSSVNDSYYLYCSSWGMWVRYSAADLYSESEFVQLSVGDDISVQCAECKTIRSIVVDERVEYIGYTVRTITRNATSDEIKGSFDFAEIPRLAVCAWKLTIPYIFLFFVLCVAFYVASKNLKALLLTILLILVLWAIYYIQASTYIVHAPIIYLYPEEEQAVSVELDLSGELTTTYPRYDGGWNIEAAPDGTLTDRNGRTYEYLFWEANLDMEPDFSNGFCVAGEDTYEFLENALSELGLNDKEADTFIMYWLPKMENNKYNVISFQTEKYEEAAGLDVYPQPDSEIRVFMAYYSLPYEVDIEPQDLSGLGNTTRTGFTLVEWGGLEVGSIDGELRRIADKG